MAAPGFLVPSSFSPGRRGRGGFYRAAHDVMVWSGLGQGVFLYGVEWSGVECMRCMVWGYIHPSIRSMNKYIPKGLVLLVLI